MFSSKLYGLHIIESAKHCAKCTSRSVHLDQLALKLEFEPLVFFKYLQKRSCAMIKDLFFELLCLQPDGVNFLYLNLEEFDPT